MTEETQELQRAEFVDTAIVEQLTRGEVDMQVSTAKRYPRSIQEFKQQALSMAIKTPEIARSCFYVIPRGGKKIEGPSIRLAEVIAVTWGNLRCETRVVSVGDKTITAQATAWDMQRNVLIRCESSRRITGKSGDRYSDDMIVMTGNAAASVALRNAIFKVVPMSYVKEIYDQCKRVAASEGGGIDAAKANWVKYFERLGVTEAQILQLLGKKGMDDVDIEDITTLQGLSTALDEGQTTIEEIFRPEPMENGTQAFGFKAKNGKTKGKSKQKPKTEPEVVEDEPPPPDDAEMPWDKHLDK